MLADPKVANASDYWGLATRAEANLLIGRPEEARADLVKAVADSSTGAGARSSTRRQLRLILREEGVDRAEVAAILAPLAPAPVLHVIDAGRSLFRKSGSLAVARQRIGQLLSELRPSAIFTSLASPAEILFAEEALARDIEVYIVLAAAEPAIAEQAIAEKGSVWVRRFRACCRKARSVTTVAEDATADAAALVGYAARVGMGLALLRAQHVDAEPLQIVLDGEVSAEDPPALRAWRDSGPRRQIALALTQEPTAPLPAEHRQERSCCALVFGDLPGFSKMPEKYLPIFWEHVMGAIGDILGASPDAVALKNTWGDAIHFVIPDVRSAAEICLAVQRRLQAVDGHLLGRDEAPTMRIGAHYGPVFEGWDPIAAHRTYYGRALSRAARIEPITPPGTVYVTEAFAAILLLESRGDFTCTYVGQVPLAKGYGTFRMYDLSPV